MVTKSISDEVTRRRPTKRNLDDDAPNKLFTMRSDFLDVIKLELQTATRVRFPSPLYQDNPEGFFRNVLGYRPWSKQVEIMNAVRDHNRVAVVSGHKIGKSNLCAGLALWKYCSFNDARVIMTSTTARQVDAILWRELRKMVARSGRCLECKEADPDGFVIPRPCEHSALVDGELGDLAKTGLKSVDFREIVGFTARESEAVAGISGSQLLYICDEASGIPDLIFEAISGNSAGGATLLLVGNGTRNEGEFFEAFHSKSRFYKTFTVSSEDTPNCVEDRDVIPGLATRAWVEEKKEEWGVDSPMYIIRVKGGFALGEDSKIFSTRTIMEAEQRWYTTEPAGRLFVGLDPAGDTGTGDDSAMSVRRGLKQLSLDVRVGLNADQHLGWILEMIAINALPNETPVVVIDRDGAIGAKLHTLIRVYLEQVEFRHAPPFEYVGVRASNAAVRMPHVYDRVRDELVANMSAWTREGGAIVTDAKLAKEMHQFESQQNVRGKTKVTPKAVIKKAIGRSPDRFDATALSLWEPRSLRQAANDNALPATDAGERPKKRAPDESAFYAEDTIDSYDAMKAFR